MEGIKIKEVIVRYIILFTLSFLMLTCSEKPGNPSDSNNVIDTLGTNLTNHPPVANAGVNQQVIAGDSVTLDGSASNDPDGDSLKYQWSMITKPNASQAMIVNSNTAYAGFIADTTGVYRVNLIVSDSALSSAPDTVTITVISDTTSVNYPPVANAGVNQQVVAGDSVTLDGSASNDPDGDSLTYQWSMIIQPNGSQVVLVNNNSISISFIVDSIGQYWIELIVSDGLLNSYPDTVIITAILDTTSSNQLPVANAGSVQVINAGEAVQLDGSSSYDPDGDSLYWSWSIVSLPQYSNASLSDSSIVNPFLQTDSAGDYIVELIVNDGQAVSAPDSVTIIANSTILPDTCISNANIIFTHDITDLTKIDVIVPPGVVSGNVIKTHTYIGNKPGENVPIYVPVDCKLYNGVKMIESGVVQYMLYFHASCEVEFLFDHIITVIDTVATLFPGPPANSSQTYNDFANPILFQAGDLIGYTTGTPQAGRWDFGVYNSTVTNIFANNARYVATYSWRWLNAVCPYDLFPVLMRTQYENLYGGASGIVVGGDSCRNPSQDILGTIKGMWFPDQDINLFSQNTLAISTTYDQGEVRIGGPGWQMWIYNTDSTFIDPGLVTSEHCYCNGTAVAYFKLISDMEMWLYYDSTVSICPDSFPSSGYMTFWR